MIMKIALGQANAVDGQVVDIGEESGMSFDAACHGCTRIIHVTLDQHIPKPVVVLGTWYDPRPVETIPG